MGGREGGSEGGRERGVVFKTADLELSFLDLSHLSDGFLHLPVRLLQDSLFLLLPLPPSLLCCLRYTLLRDVFLLQLWRREGERERGREGGGEEERGREGEREIGREGERGE